LAILRPRPDRSCAAIVDELKDCSWLPPEATEWTRVETPIDLKLTCAFHRSPQWEDLALLDYLFRGGDDPTATLCSEERLQLLIPELQELFNAYSSAYNAPNLDGIVRILGNLPPSFAETLAAFHPWVSGASPWRMDLTKHGYTGMAAEYVKRRRWPEGQVQAAFETIVTKISSGRIDSGAARTCLYDMLRRDTP